MLGGDLAATAIMGNREQLALALVSGLNLALVVAQIAVAEETGSLSLLSDGFHNLSDVAAVLVALAAQRLRDQDRDGGATAGLPFGHARLQVLSGLVNALLLVSLCFYLLLAALPRLVEPEELEINNAYLGVSGVSMSLNVASVALLCCCGSKHAAMLHVHVGGSCSVGGCGDASCGDDECSPTQQMVNATMTKEDLQVPFGFMKPARHRCAPGAGSFSTTACGPWPCTHWGMPCRQVWSFAQAS